MIFVCLAIAARAIQALQYVAGGSAPLYWRRSAVGLEGQGHRLGLVQIACNGSIVEQPVAQRPISRLAGRPGRLCNARVSLLIHLLLHFSPQRLDHAILLARKLTVHQ